MQQSIKEKDSKQINGRLFTCTKCHKEKHKSKFRPSWLKQYRYICKSCARVIEKNNRTKVLLKSLNLLFLDQ